MNMPALIGLIAAIVILGGGAWYFSSHQAPGAAGPNQMAGAPGNGAGTLSTLMALTGSFTCSVATAAGDTQSSGTVFISNGQMRGDFNSTTKASETVIETHLIKAGGYTYTWSSAAPQGVKFADSAVPANTSGTGSQGVDDKTQVTYSCTPWSEDPSKFAPPSTVSFMDMSAMMQGAMPVKGGTYPQGPTKQPYAY